MEKYWRSEHIELYLESPLMPFCKRIYEEVDFWSHVQMPAKLPSLFDVIVPLDNPQESAFRRLNFQEAFLVYDAPRKLTAVEFVHWVYQLHRHGVSACGSFGSFLDSVAVDALRLIPTWDPVAEPPELVSRRKQQKMKRQMEEQKEEEKRRKKEAQERRKRELEAEFERENAGGSPGSSAAPPAGGAGGGASSAAEAVSKEQDVGRAGVEGADDAAGGSTGASAAPVTEAARIAAAGLALQEKLSTEFAELVKSGQIKGDRRFVGLNKRATQHPPVSAALQPDHRFISPETILGGALGCHSDIFAVGLLLAQNELRSKVPICAGVSIFTGAGINIA